MGKGFNILIGVLMMVIGVLMFVIPGITFLILMILLAAALAISGLGRFMDGRRVGAEQSNRWTNMITGLATIVLAAVIIVMMIWFPSATVDFVLIIYVVILFILGFARIINGFRGKFVPKWYKTLNLIMGVATIVIAILMIFVLLGGGDPTSDPLLILYFGISLIINGFMRMLYGLVYKPIKVQAA